MTSMTPARQVFCISDRTGITVEALGRALLSQFEGIDCEFHTVPFVDSAQRLQAVIERIDAAAQGQRPLVFSSLTRPELREALSRCAGLCIDFFDTFLGDLQQELGAAPAPLPGRIHGLHDTAGYNRRMAALNFTLRTDDGAADADYGTADVIITGVSRTGKTPTCLYLALQHGVRAANYPLTVEDLEGSRLPEALRGHRERLHGLTIEPERLQQIRAERRPGSRYASFRQCRHEVAQARALFRREGIPVLDVSRMSVEEAAARILHGIR